MNSSTLKIGAMIVLIFCYTQALFLYADYTVHGRVSLDFGWDAAWYKSIMADGYQVSDPTYEKQQNIVFFPLYPLVVKLVKGLTGFSSHLSMYITSSLLYLGLLGFLAALLSHYYPMRITNAALATFALNPFAIYFLNGYSEPLWVLLVVAYCYFTMVEKRFVLGALIVGLATSARPYGTLIVPIFFYQLLSAHTVDAGEGILRRYQQQRRYLLLVPVMMSGLTAYMIYLYAAFGDPLAFVHGQQAWDSVAHRTLWSTFSPGKILSPLRDYARGTFHTLPVVLACLLYLLNAALTIAYVRKLPRSFTALNIVFLFFFYFVLNHFSSVGRFLLVCFPTSLALALALDGQNPLKASNGAYRLHEPKPPERIFSGLALAVVLLFFSKAYYTLAVLFFKARWVA